MFGLSFSEVAVIFLVALIVFGPKKLPSIAKQLGNTLAAFKKASEGARREFYNALYEPAKEPPLAKKTEENKPPVSLPADSVKEKKDA
jgi:sec-independent protein translocase protein TatA